MLHAEFREKFDAIDVVRRALESRAAYLRRLNERIIARDPHVLINSVVPCVQAALPLLPSQMVRITVVHSIHERESRIASANAELVDWVVAVSENVRARLEPRLGAHVKLATIPVGLELPDDTQQRTAAALPLRLLYAGRIAPEKNLPGLLAVFSALHRKAISFRATIVGDGKGLSALRRQVKKFPFAGQIDLAGLRAPKEVSEMLEKHDFLLLTSHYEGTPHIVIEAMAHGMVVLASRLPGATDRMITHEVNGFLCNRTCPDEYAQILQELHANPAQFTRISAAATVTARRRYSADTLAGEYEGLFCLPSARARQDYPAVNGSGMVSKSLFIDFPGVVRQCKHRMGDVWRSLVYHQHPAFQ